MERLPEGNSERGKYAGQIMSECESVLWQLEELDRATAMAEQDFMRFKVDANELASRKRWTAATKTAVSHLNAKALAVIEARKARGGGGYGGEGSRLDDAIGQANDAYLNQQTDQQQLLMQRQDVDLDDISASINRIGQVGLTIGEELETQGKMLDDLEQDVEGTKSRLQAAQRKMNQARSGEGRRKRGMGWWLLGLFSGNGRGVGQENTPPSRVKYSFVTPARARAARADRRRVKSQFRSSISRDAVHASACFAFASVETTTGVWVRVRMCAPMLPLQSGVEEGWYQGATRHHRHPHSAAHHPLPHRVHVKGT